MESSANLLVKHCRHVLVRAAYDNYVRIRFRADDLRDPRCYFNKVPSQHKRWRETGGALITWRNSNLEGPHDAILFVECPKSMEALHGALQSTGLVGVIYEPPSWRQHEQQIARRHFEKPGKFKRQMKRLQIVREFVGMLPVLSRPRLRSVLAAASRLSVAPASPSASAPPIGTVR